MPIPASAQYNQWMASQVFPNRCTATIPKQPLTNQDKRIYPTRCTRLCEDQQKDQINMCTDYTPPLQTHATNGTREAQRDDDKRTIANLRAELKRYKRKNKALKEQLKEVLNVKELQKTLRMTLHSFGVPLPCTPQSRSRTERCVLPWQGGDCRQEMVTVISDDGKEEEEEEDSNDVQAGECQGPLQSHGSYMCAFEPPEGLPYFMSECNRERETTGVFNHNAGSLPNGDVANGTVHCPSPQDELVPERAGNGFLIDPERLNSLALKKGATYTLLTRNLMPLVFSMDEMTTSCVRGERARGKGATTSPARQALDQIKVQAIINFVRHRFPNVQSYQIIQSMNQKLVDVRSTMQKRRQQATKRGAGTLQTE